MSDKTDEIDETAREIAGEWVVRAGCSIGDVDNLRPASHLVPMAKFWLMKEQIADLLESANEGELRSMDYDRAEWLLDKIKELDG